jgi:hypothetical protein
MAWFWHIHHEVLCEEATEPIKNRIAYIKDEKDPSEVPTRLRLLKPVKSKANIPRLVKDYDAKRATLLTDYDANLAPLLADYNAKLATLDCDLTRLHAKECPDCPWNGLTIFPEATP